MAEASLDPVFQIQRVYLKDVSLEQPNSPAILLEPGERTGHYRLGTESPLMNGDQPGKISVADLAVAIVDELEAPRHLQQRFTVAY